MEHVITLSCQGLTVEPTLMEHVLHISNSNGEGALLKYPTYAFAYLRRIAMKSNVGKNTP